jgi:protein ImuB
VSAAAVRALLVWCADWPVIAAEIVEGVPASGPVVVLAGNRVLACSEAARADGVRRGLRRREAQSRCPQLIVVEHDPSRDARAFEPVVAAVEEVAVGVEVIRPGACALAARGPARYFGGEEEAAERIVEQVAQSCAVESQVGIADGVFAAGLAARSGRIVTPGRTREFLSGVPVEALDRPELTDLLRRLGIKTLGDFAALPASDVLTRFGFDGALAHRLAAGYDHRPLAVRKPPPDLDVADTYDEPLERVDVAAFAGRVLAERLHERLAAYGLACTRLGIEAVTANGQELHRVWRHDGTLTAAAIAERVRWQLDGWLTGARRGGPARPTAGLVRLRLVPDGVLVHLGLQPGLWGDAGGERERAHRALSRIQGLLGPEAVVTPVLGGGRSADDQVRLVPWGDERAAARPAADHLEPIPGTSVHPVLARLPDPAPISGPRLAAAPDPPSAAPVSPASHPAWAQLSHSGSVRSLAAARAATSTGATSPPVATSASVSDLAAWRSSAAAASRSSAPASRSAPPSVPTPDPALATPAPSPTAVSGPNLALIPDLAPTLVSNPTPASNPTPTSTSTPAPAPSPTSASSPTQALDPSAASASSAASDPTSALDPTPAPDPTPARNRPPSLALAPSSVPARSPAPTPAQRASSSTLAGTPALAAESAQATTSPADDDAAGMPPLAVTGGTTRSTGGRKRASRPPAALPPWPGRLPRPAPALVLAQPLPAVVLDRSGAPVGVSARLELTGDPASLLLEKGPAEPGGLIEIVGWAGPWPVDERWWAPDEARRRARFQVALVDGRALLLSLFAGHWAVEAIYD